MRSKILIKTLLIYRPILAAFVASIPFVAFSTLTLNYFYCLGALYGDAGVIAYVMSHNSIVLIMPKVAGGSSFFATHFTPIFLPLSVLSRVIPLSNVQYFALFSGICYMLPAIAVYWLLISTYKMASNFRCLSAAIISVLFAFNGIALAAARNPHFEMLIVGSGICFFVALVQSRYGIAMIFFLICLATREDAGFDLFALIFTTIAGNYFIGISLARQRPQIIFGVIAILYSIIVIGFQRIYFPHGNALRTVYFGTPPFSTISFNVIINRLAFYIVDRLYIFLPAYIAVMWAIRTREFVYVSGFVAFLPWILLNLFAASPYAGSLSNYYSFPLIFSLCWPLISYLLRYQYSDLVLPTRLRDGPIPLFCILVISSFVGVQFQQNPQNIEFPSSYYEFPSLKKQKLTDIAVRGFAVSTSRLGRVAADGSVIALDPNEFNETQILWNLQRQSPNTIIFFARGQGTDIAVNLAFRDKLDFHYKIPGTSLYVASDRNLDGFDGAAPSSFKGLLHK